MTGELKKYEFTVRVKLPNQVKTSECKMVAAGDTPIEAYAVMEAEWKKATELRDVSIKEVEAVMTA
jgi:hypothetical protein